MAEEFSVMRVRTEQDASERGGSQSSLVGPSAFFEGSRIGVLLIHGLTGTPKEMLTIAKRLHKYGFTVSCPVLAGHCGSKEDLLATNWHDWAASAEEGFFKLKEKTDLVFAGGISAGAVLCLYLAEKCPSVLSGMALYSITLKWDGWSIPKYSFLLPYYLRLPYLGKRYHFVEAFPYGIKNESLRKRIVTKMRSGDTAAAGHTNTPGASVRELWRMVDQVKAGLSGIKTPALFVHAENDDIASLRSNARFAMDRMAGSTELLSLKDSYHMVTVDQERHKVADATADFFYRCLNQKEKEELSSRAVEKIPGQKAEKPASLSRSLVRLDLPVMI